MINSHYNIDIVFFFSPIYLVKHQLHSTGNISELLICKYSY